jgi:diguanylate cyclase (GGDEF)-like protein
MNDAAAAGPITGGLEHGTGLLVLGPDWKVLHVNAVAARLLRRRPEQLVGRNLWDEFPDALTAEFGRSYRAVVATGEATDFEAFYPPLDTWFDVHAAPREEGGLHVTFRSVGMVKAARAERERLLDAEREARLVAEATHERLTFSLDHDPLTGLVNRSAALRWIDFALDSGREVAVIVCDLTDFKRVNEGMGHTCGDEVLRRTAERLQGLVRGDDLVARVGGNEFVVAVAERSVDRLPAAVLEAVGEPMEVSGRRIVMAANLGTADSRVTAATAAEAILRAADMALYRAKHEGPNHAAVYDRDLHERLADRLTIEADLRAALECGQLHLVFQPAYDLQINRVVGVEALCRWDHPTRGPISPAEFIPVAEATGLIVPLGEWVLGTATDFLRAGRAVLGDRPFTVWVNVSGSQFLDPSFLPTVERLIEGVEDRIGLEFTESIFLEDPTTAALQLQHLVDLGVKVAIDDFGTGYSSLARITQYPIHVIKVDRSFVDRIDEPQHRAIVVAIVDLAHAFGTRTIAEGVERREQIHILREIGCDEASGYLLARPSRPDDLRAAVTEGVQHLRQDRLF